MNGFALKREEYEKGIITALTEIVLKKKNLNAARFYDANTVAEDFFCGLLNRLYGYSLQNMNNIQANYPGIDLGIKAFQEVRVQMPLQREMVRRLQRSGGQ